MRDWKLRTEGDKSFPQACSVKRRNHTATDRRWLNATSYTNAIVNENIDLFILFNLVAYAVFYKNDLFL
jgi:hypothetical protein